MIYHPTTPPPSGSSVCSSQCVHVPVAEAAELTMTPEASVPLLELSDLDCVMGLTVN